MWWLLALFGGAFLYGITRARQYTHNTYVENYADCDGGGASYCDTSDNGNNDD